MGKWNKVGRKVRPLLEMAVSGARLAYYLMMMMGRDS